MSIILRSLDAVDSGCDLRCTQNRRGAPRSSTSTSTTHPGIVSYSPCCSLSILSCEAGLVLSISLPRQTGSDTREILSWSTPIGPRLLLSSASLCSDDLQPKIPLRDKKAQEDVTCRPVSARQAPAGPHYALCFSVEVRRPKLQDRPAESGNPMEATPRTSQKGKYERTQ